MKEAFPFFLIDPTIDLNDQERIAYAQDVFISRTLLDGGSLILCNGPIKEKEGKCKICKAPTREMPHAHKEDVLPFSSSFVGLPDLMQIILRTWPLQDLRLLGDIMRYEPLEVAQDIIHVSQKRHPLGKTHMYQVVKHHIRDIEPDFIRNLAPDVYFVPYRSLFGQRMYEKYSGCAAKLVLGCVAAGSKGRDRSTTSCNASRACGACRVSASQDDSSVSGWFSGWVIEHISTTSFLSLSKCQLLFFHGSWVSFCEEGMHDAQR